MFRNYFEIAPANFNTTTPARPKSARKFSANSAAARRFDGSQKVNAEVDCVLSSRRTWPTSKLRLINFQTREIRQERRIVLFAPLKGVIKVILGSARNCFRFVSRRAPILLLAAVEILCHF